MPMKDGKDSRDGSEGSEDKVKLRVESTKIISPKKKLKTCPTFSRSMESQMICLRRIIEYVLIESN